MNGRLCGIYDKACRSERSCFSPFPDLPDRSTTVGGVVPLSRLILLCHLSVRR